MQQLARRESMEERDDNAGGGEKRIPKGRQGQLRALIPLRGLTAVYRA